MNGYAGLILDRRATYVLVEDLDRGEGRTLRLDRITKAALATEPG